MVFSSSLFLLYFLPVFLLVYYLLPKVLKNAFLLLASIVFYAWGAPEIIVLILASIIIDFYLVKYIHTSDRNRKRILTGVSLALNIGLLAWFKYANFFVDNVNAVISTLGFKPMNWVHIALPIGISFFTFIKITYTIDVYRKVHAPLKKLVDYASFILMFPHLIAGPIVRFNEVADQITDRQAHETLEYRFSGFFRFAVGLAKKVLIANVLAVEVDRIFAIQPDLIGTGQAWLGIIAYAFQIYYDFSGYSDMALGLAMMIGFKFPENFNNPYISQSITEFWRRWHITLGRFMRDYLYIPLGGSRVKPARLYFNLWVVFAISGLWHGAAWNFVIWGVFHGCFLVMDRLFLLKFFSKIGKYPSILITFLITLVGWVLFRSESLTYAMDYLSAMFSWSYNYLPVSMDRKFFIIMIFAAIFAFMAVIKGMEAWQVRVLEPKFGVNQLGWRVAVGLVVFFLCVGAISSSGFNPFIYFRF
jgi:alginate O-acetyltransferase complex protein AlgI